MGGRTDGHEMGGIMSMKYGMDGHAKTKPPILNSMDVQEKKNPHFFFFLFFLKWPANSPPKLITIINYNTENLFLLPSPVSLVSKWPPSPSPSPSPSPEFSG